MEIYLVSGNNVIKDDIAVSSPRYQWLKKNRQIFNTEQEAWDYILKTSPEVADSVLAEQKKVRLDRLVDDYDEVKTKEDFEKLFDLTISVQGYDKIREFIDHIREK